MNMNEEERRRLIEKLRRELGDIVLGALEDGMTNEVQLNPDGTLWIDRFDTGRQKAGKMSAVQAENLLGTIASLLGTVVNYDRPLLEGELPIRDCRFAGAIPPITTAPAFSIRQPAGKVYTLDDYVAVGIITREQADFLTQAVIQGLNILIVGGTGSGKTTLLNALLDALCKAAPDVRLAIIEDTREIQCPNENKVPMRTKVDGEPITMTKLLEFSLRIKPDRIICGEVRNAAADAMLEAWNTGHDGGFCTVHANNARAGTSRVVNLVRKAGVPEEVAKRQIAETVQVIVSIQKKYGGKRQIEEIVRIRDLKDGEFVFEPV